MGVRIFLNENHRIFSNGTTYVQVYVDVQVRM